MTVLANSFGVLGVKENGGEGRRENAGIYGHQGSRVAVVLRMALQGFGVLTCVAVGLNVFLATLYYWVGMFKQEKILDHQIQLASALVIPVPIRIEVLHGGHYDGASFIASEWWFVDRGIPVAHLPAKPERPRMKIHKTDTWVPLTPDWKFSLQDPKDEQLFREKGLIED